MRSEGNESRAARRLRSRIEQLEYARDMIRELRDMMAAERFEMLTFQLEMAYLEASDRLRELHAGPMPPTSPPSNRTYAGRR